jgi:hypothetical protein
MYGRADGMPSFQLTVAVRARNTFEDEYITSTHPQQSKSVDDLFFSLPAMLNSVSLTLLPRSSRATYSPSNGTMSSRPGVNTVRT